MRCMIRCTGLAAVAIGVMAGGISTVDAQTEIGVGPETAILNRPPAPGGMIQSAPGWGRTATDRHVISWLGSDYRADIALGRFAASRALGGQVREYAERMVLEQSDFMTRLEAALPGALGLGVMRGVESLPNGSVNRLPVGHVRSGSIIDVRSEADRSGLSSEGNTPQSSASIGRNIDANQTRVARRTGASEGSTLDSTVGARTGSTSATDLDTSRHSGRVINATQRQALASRTAIQRTAGYRGAPGVLAPEISDRGADTAMPTPYGTTDLVHWKQQISERELATTQQMLGRYQGVEFDRAYLGHEVVEQARRLAGLQVLNNYASPRLRQVLAEGIQQAEQHLNQAQVLMEQLRPTAGQAVAAPPARQIP